MPHNQHICLQKVPIININYFSQNNYKNVKALMYFYMFRHFFIQGNSKETNNTSQLYQNFPPSSQYQQYCALSSNDVININKLLVIFNTTERFHPCICLCSFKLWRNWLGQMWQVNFFPLEDGFISPIPCFFDKCAPSELLYHGNTLSSEDI